MTAAATTAAPARRADLRFASVDAVAADVRRLEAGYVRTGAWSLPQICWHLRLAIDEKLMPPAGPPTADQDRQRLAMDAMLDSRHYPQGLTAPQDFQPPADCDRDEVDKLIAALGRLAAYDRPMATHGRFGPVTREQLVDLVLIHCAHHLGFLVPEGSPANPEIGARG